MPITKIVSENSGPVVSSTCVVCLKDSAVDASALVLGTETKAHVIALPPCSCGAQEFLQRTFDVHPVEHQAGHRKTVNALAEHLKVKGLIHPNHVDAIAAMTTPVQIGTLIGVVPDSSLSPSIVRRAKSVAPDAVAAAKAVLEAAKAAYAKAVGAAAP